LVVFRRRQVTTTLLSFSTLIAGTLRLLPLVFESSGISHNKFEHGAYLKRACGKTNQKK